MIENITKIMLIYHKKHVELEREPYTSAINKVLSLRVKYANYNKNNAKTPEDRIYCLAFQHGIF